MRDGVTYQELGADYFARRDLGNETIRRSVKQLEALGYHVTIEQGRVILSSVFSEQKR